MIRDTTTIDISLPILPHRKKQVFIGHSAWKGREKVMKIFQRAENYTGGKTMANRGAQNVALPSPSI